MRLKVRLPAWPRVRLGLRAKLVLSFLVVIFPAFFLLLASGYRHSASQQGLRLAHSRALGQAAAALVQAQLDSYATSARAILASTEGPISSTASLQAVLAARPEYLNAFLLDAQGRVLAVAPQGARPDVGADLLAQVGSAPGPAVSGLLQGGPGGRPAFQLLVGGARADGSPAVAGFTVDARALGRALSPLAGDGAPDVTLCDGQGLSLYSTLDPNLTAAPGDWSGCEPFQQALAGAAVTAPRFASPLDGQLLAGAALPVPGVAWVVNVHQPASDGLDYLRGQGSAEVVLFVALAALALLAAAVLGGWLTSPLARLAQHARSLGSGQLNERIALRTGDEVEDLASALNSMAAQVDERDRRLRSRTAEFDAIITQSADGIAIHGPAGELQRLNPAGRRILGSSPQRLGLSLAEQVEWLRLRNAAGGPADPSDLPVAAALRGETRLAQEFRIATEEGEERFIAFSASPLIDSRGGIYGAVSTFRDMTHAHMLQQEKDDFISLVSHELKTPITAIKGYAQMLLRRVEETKEGEKSLKGLRIINDEVDRMVDLINQLLDVSRLETQRLQLNLDLVDLVSLASDAVERLQMTTSKHTLRLRAPHEPIWVQGDTMRLAQVLGNLIMNAIKYSPQGGPIEITIESSEGRGWVSVRDWGIGVAPEDQPHLFQRFYRGSSRRPGALAGMGLGLYISREIVQHHHGDIVFHSEPSQGSTFLFWLPLARAGEPGQRARAHAAAAGASPAPPLPGA